MNSKITNNSNMPTKNNKVLSIAGIVAGTAFMAVAYYLPVDSFMSLFAAGLFLIPTAFFVYMVQKMAKGDDDAQATR